MAALVDKAFNIHQVAALGVLRLLANSVEQFFYGGGKASWAGGLAEDEDDEHDDGERLAA